MKKSKRRTSSRFEFSPESLNALDKETLVSMLLKMHEQYAQLSETVQALVREKHGPKTERFVDPDQMHIFQSDDVQSSESGDAASATDETSGITDGGAPRPKGKGRPGERTNPRPSNMKVVQRRGPQPDEQQLRCSCGFTRVLVNEVSRGSRLCFQPAAVFWEEFLASVFACQSCGDTLTSEPDAPPAALKIGADPGLQAIVAVERFDEATPLYRQERRFARIGANIARSTMCGWLASGAQTVRPLYDWMHKILLQSSAIETDDSPMKVQDRSKAKNIKIGRIWTYRGDDEHPVNLFDYTVGRGRAGPMVFLKAYSGFLIGDCFSGNQALCAETGAIHVACHAHARRYFIKAEPNNKVACSEMLRMYRDLFEVERTAKELGITGDDLRLMRMQESEPILKRMKKWLDDQSIVALPKSSFGKAVNYCLNNWTELTNFLLDGRLRIDNNLAEQEMKRHAINRKNSLFFGSDNGGENAAVFMSLISTCRRHNVEPWAYLRDVIETLTRNPNADLDALLPYNWKPRSAEMGGIAPTPEMAFA